MKSTSNAPIYMKVYNRLKNQILSGSYPSGSFLPTESELEQIYQVSRTTIRKAVKMLSDEGFLSVRQGCGTMVMDTRTTQNYNQVTSVTESLKKRGYEVTTASMMIDVIPATREIAMDLQIPEETAVARIQRLQLADGNPVTLMENYVEYAKVPDIEKHQGHFVALYQFLEETYGLTIDSTRGSDFCPVCRFYGSAGTGNRAEGRSFSDPPHHLLPGPSCQHRSCTGDRNPV